MANALRSGADDAALHHCSRVHAAALTMIIQLCNTTTQAVKILAFDPQMLRLSGRCH